MSDGVLNVLYQFNEKYAPYACVSITSLFENNRESSITVYILSEELSDDSVNRFRKLGNKYHQSIIIKDTSKMIAEMKTWGMPAYREAYSANLRLFIPYFLEDTVDRILYLDADTILNGSIQKLFGINLDNKAVGMVVDSLGNKYKNSILGESCERPYYNSGVILFDLNKWRKEKYSEKIIENIKFENNCYASPDQDLINVVVADDIEKLSLKYNFQPVHYVYPYKIYAKCYGTNDYYSQDEIEDAKRNVCIYHSFRYVGEFPWDKNTIHPYRKMFDKYLELSTWNDYKRKPAKSSLIMKIEKILYKVIPKSWFLLVFSYVHHKYIMKSPEAKRSSEVE